MLSEDFLREPAPTNSSCKNSCENPTTSGSCTSEFLHCRAISSLQFRPDDQGDQACDARKRLNDGDGLFLLLFVKGGAHRWPFVYPGLSVMLNTGYAEQMEEGTAKAMRGFQKPVALEILFAELKALLRGSAKVADR